MFLELAELFNLLNILFVSFWITISRKWRKLNFRGLRRKNLPMQQFQRRNSSNSSSNSRNAIDTMGFWIWLYLYYVSTLSIYILPHIEEKFCNKLTKIIWQPLTNKLVILKLRSSNYQNVSLGKKWNLPPAYYVRKPEGRMLVHSWSKSLESSKSH